MRGWRLAQKHYGRLFKFDNFYAHRRLLVATIVTKSSKIKRINKVTVEHYRAMIFYDFSAGLNQRG